MGPDLFFDGMRYDPSKLMQYLAGFKIKNMKAAMSDLAKLNA
ncbi:MAG: hypothetical protein KatS3mg123_1322 [Burkholderiales bacterium]|nr:MAG: hypothetical protein KatS3mg123_1322 [Burkholderiales bacterium]